MTASPKKKENQGAIQIISDTLLLNFGTPPPVFLFLFFPLISNPICYYFLNELENRYSLKSNLGVIPNFLFPNKFKKRALKAKKKSQQFRAAFNDDSLLYHSR
jgi:hypothetical protein